MQLLRVVLLVVACQIGVGIAARGQDDAYSPELEQPRVQRPRFFDSPAWHRTMVGGNFGFGLAGMGFSLELSPFMGYRPYDYLIVGAGPVYSFFSYRDLNNTRVQVHVYGARVLARHLLFRSVFAHIEYERTWLAARTDQGNLGGTLNPRVLAGGATGGILVGGRVGRWRCCMM